MNISEARMKSLELIKNHPLAGLATVSRDNSPYACTIYVIADDDLNLHFITKEDTEKWKQINNNPSVALVIAGERSRQTVQIRGKAAREKTVESDASVLEKLTASIPSAFTHPEWSLPVEQLDAGSYVMVKVETKWFRYASFQAKKPIFVQIIPDESGQS